MKGSYVWQKEKTIVTITFIHNYETLQNDIKSAGEVPIRLFILSPDRNRSEDNAIYKKQLQLN